MPWLVILELLLLVSHDREFLDGLTDRVYFIKDKNIKVYHEPVTQFIKSYYSDLEVKKENKKLGFKKLIIKSSKSAKVFRAKNYQVGRKTNQFRI